MPVASFKERAQLRQRGSHSALNEVVSNGGEFETDRQSLTQEKFS
jgi:hypothetical protein